MWFFGKKKDPRDELCVASPLGTHNFKLEHREVMLSPFARWEATLLKGTKYQRPSQHDETWWHREKVILVYKCEHCSKLYTITERNP